MSYSRFNGSSIKVKPVTPDTRPVQKAPVKLSGSQVSDTVKLRLKDFPQGVCTPEGTIKAEKKGAVTRYTLYPI